MLGVGELLVIAAAVVIFFSARKIPELGASLGKSFRSFKGGLQGKSDERKMRDVTPLEKTEKESGDSEGENDV